MRAKGRSLLPVALFCAFGALRVNTATAKDAPSATTTTSTASGDPVALVQATAAAKDGATSSRDDGARALDAIGPLAAERKTALAATAAQRRSVEAHLRTADAAFKRYRAAGDNATTDPKMATVLEGARSEYDAAITEGAALQTALVALRKLEDNMASQVVASARATASADMAAVSAGAAVKQLKSLVANQTRDAKTAATGAATEAGKARTVAGLGQPSGFAAKKAKDQAQDQAFAVRVSDAKTALARVTSALHP